MICVSHARASSLLPRLPLSIPFVHFDGVFTVPPPTNFVNARFVLASHWPIWGATALARLTRARLIGVDGVEPQEGRRCFASCVVGQRNGEGTDHGDGADFCVDFGDINICKFCRSDSCGGSSRRHEAGRPRCHLGCEVLASHIDAMPACVVRLRVKESAQHDALSS